MFLRDVAATSKRIMEQLFFEARAIFCYLGYAGALKRLIKSKKVLIVGSGLSAAELEKIPSDVLIFTCNAGLNLFVKKSLKDTIDLLFCQRKLISANYNGVVESMKRIRVKVWLTDDPQYVRKRKDLDGFYDSLFFDHAFNNYCLKRLIRPYQVTEIKGASRTGWTSAGILLLQYALFFEASEIYVIGLDFGRAGYFWGDPVNPAKWHHYDIDENFVQLVSRKYHNIYSLSKNSPIAKHIPYKSFYFES